MVKKISKGSLLGRSSSSSKDKTGLYLVCIVGFVAVVALFLMVKGGSSSSEEVMVVDEYPVISEDSSALTGQAGRVRENYGVNIKSPLLSVLNVGFDLNTKEAGALPDCSEAGMVDGDCAGIGADSCGGCLECSGSLLIPCSSEGSCIEEWCALCEDTVLGRGCDQILGGSVETEEVISSIKSY